MRSENSITLDNTSLGTTSPPLLEAGVLLGGGHLVLSSRLVIIKENLLCSLD